MNSLSFLVKKSNGEKISMVTCYDYWSACLLADSDVDCLLVGDSAAMVMHGHASTLPISIEQMAWHVSAVSREAAKKFIVGDLPFLSYRKDLTENMKAVEALVKAGAHAVKLEGAAGNLELVNYIVESGVPVIGHLGLTPQSVNMLGGYKVQGRDQQAADKLRTQSLLLEKAGVTALVLECVPSVLAREVSESLKIPTIGIGAGPDTDGQVLVLHDLLGMNKDFRTKFVRQFLSGQHLVVEALNNFHQAVVSGDFPSLKESFE